MYYSIFYYFMINGKNIKPKNLSNYSFINIDFFNIYVCAIHSPATQAVKDITKFKKKVNRRSLAE